MAMIYARGSKPAGTVQGCCRRLVIMGREEGKQMRSPGAKGRRDGAQEAQKTVEAVENDKDMSPNIAQKPVPTAY